VDTSTIQGVVDGTLDADVIVSSAGVGIIDNLNQLAQMGCADNEIFKINGTAWQCEADGGPNCTVDGTITGVITLSQWVE